jgi:hypothetical protein
MATKTTSKSQGASKKSAPVKAKAKTSATSKTKTTTKTTAASKKSGPVNRKPISGKEKNADQMSKTRVQLLQEAKKAGLTGISRLTKEQLVKSLSKVR